MAALSVRDLGPGLAPEHKRGSWGGSDGTQSSRAEPGARAMCGCVFAAAK